MAFVNLPPALQDIFNGIYDRLAKLETGPNQAMYTAVIAENNALQALNEASQALAQATQSYNTASQALIKDANTITNASNQLTGINSNGITVYSGASASSGARVVMNSLGIVGYNSSNTPTFTLNSSNGAFSTQGAIFTNSSIYGGDLNINGNAIIDSTGKLTATQAVITGTITAYSGSFAGSITASAGTIGGFNIGTNYLSSVDASSGYRISSSTGIANFSTVNTSGAITTNGGLVLSTGTGNLSMGTNNINNAGSIGGASLSVSGAVSAGTTVTSTSAATVTTSAATNCYITTGGTFTRTSNTSSQRYKDNIINIADVPTLDPKALLNLPIRAFKYKQDYLPTTDDRYDKLLPGFIAEEVAAIYPTAVDYENGEVETWNSQYIIPALLALIQDLNQRVAILEGGA